MNPFMVTQVSLLRKSFLTEATNVLFVRRMVPDMVQQRSLPVEDLLAKRALPFFAQQNLAVHVDQRLFQLDGARLLQAKNTKINFPPKNGQQIQVMMNEANINKLFLSRVMCSFFRCCSIDEKLFHYNLECISSFARVSQTESFFTRHCNGK